jgi:DNA repair protein RecO
MSYPNLRKIELKVTGVILTSFEGGPQTKVLVILTKEFGRIHVSSSTNNSSKKSFINRFEPFDYGELVLKKRNSINTMWSLSSTSTLRTFPKLRHDIEALIFSSLMVKLILAVTEQEHESDGIYYDLLLNCFNKVGIATNLKQKFSSFYEFLYQLLLQNGILPADFPVEKSVKGLIQLKLIIENYITIEIPEWNKVEILLNKYIDSVRLN